MARWARSSRRWPNASTPTWRRSGSTTRSSRSTERRQQLLPDRVGARVRDVEGEARRDVAPALAQLLGDRRHVTHRGELAEDVVADDVAHLLPLFFFRHAGELRLEIAPPVVLEHPAVR